MKIIVIGATGTIGGAVAAALEADHEVVRVSRSSEPVRVDLDDPRSLDALLASVDDVDAVVCTAAHAALVPLAELSGEDVAQRLGGKLLGQVGLLLRARDHLRDGGSVTLTSGAIPHSLPGSAVGAMVNAGLEAFVRAAAPELPRGIRANAVSPGWVRETLLRMGQDGSAGTPVRDVARAYVDAVEGTAQGETIVPTASGRDGAVGERVARRSPAPTRSA